VPDAVDHDVESAGDQGTGQQPERAMERRRRSDGAHQPPGADRAGTTRRPDTLAVGAAPCGAEEKAFAHLVERRADGQVEDE